MGSPLTFCKLQHAPAFWALDRLGLGGLIDHPIAHQATLLPIVRLGSLWIWLAALLADGRLGRSALRPAGDGVRGLPLRTEPEPPGPRRPRDDGDAPGRLLGGGVPALLRDFLGDGSTPGLRRLGAASAAWRSPASSRRRSSRRSWACAAGSERLRKGRSPRSMRSLRVARLLAVFVVVMIASNLAVTGFATATPSEHRGLASDALGPVRRRRFLVERSPRRRSRGLGRLRDPGPPPAIRRAELPAGRDDGRRGWWYYYLVALAVKVPLAFWGLMLAARSTIRTRIGRRPADPDLDRARFLALTALGSTPELRGPLPPAAGAPGDRLGLGAGRGESPAIERVGGRRADRLLGGGRLDPPARALVFQRRSPAARPAGVASSPTPTSTGARGSGRSPSSRRARPNTAT